MFKSAIALTAAITALIWGSNALSSPPVPSGTIAISATTPGPYAFQSLIAFDVTTSDLKGNQYPLVYVECYSQVDGALLYGQLDLPTVDFLLGGGSSTWWMQRDDASCLAHLYAYGGKEKGNDTIVELTDPIGFSATGS